MRTQLATSTRRHDHPPQPIPTTTARRVGPLDRAALRLGLALITWGRRTRPAGVRSQTGSSAETHEALLERERIRAEHLAQSLSQFR